MNKELRQKLIKAFGEDYKSYALLLFMLHEEIDTDVGGFDLLLKHGFIYWDNDSYKLVYPFYEVSNEVEDDSFSLIDKLQEEGVSNKKIQDSCKVSYRVLITSKGVKDAYKKLLKSHTESEVFEACKEYYLRNIRLNGKPKTLLNYLEQDCSQDIKELEDQDDYDPRFR